MADTNPDLPVTPDVQTPEVETPLTVKRPADWIRPAADVAETENGLELWLDVPGVAKDSVKLEVEGLELRVEAPRDDRFGYRRIFTLPRQVDPTGITAEMSAGVLHLTLPRAEAFSRRVISIA
ncbi:MAG: Hsp20/alpha crystallin family protein [Myxococcota bacterium]